VVEDLRLDYYPMFIDIFVFLSGIEDNTPLLHFAIEFDNSTFEACYYFFMEKTDDYDGFDADQRAEAYSRRSTILLVCY